MKVSLSIFTKNIKTFLQRIIITLQMFFENGIPNHAAACAFGFLLSITPMLLLLAFFMLFIYESSPRAVVAMIGTIPFLGEVFDEQWFSKNFFTFSRLSIPGIISIISIIWASRILAMAIYRGLRSVFPTRKTRSGFKNALTVIVIEVSAIIFIFLVIMSSRTAMRFYELLEFLPQRSIVIFLTSHFGGQVFYISLLGIAVFIMYLFVPIKPPRKSSAFQGTLLCIFIYSFVVMILGFILNIARYNFLYGTFGNLIIILMNVYFFFNFFFIGAQFAFVTDSFDALMFSRVRKIRFKALKKSRAAGVLKKLGPYYILNKFFNPSKSNINKYLRYYKKNEVIFTHEDIIDDIFYILEGEVEMSISSKDDDGDIFSGIVKADSFFGNVDYVLSENREITVKAKTDVSLFVISTSLLDTIIKNDSSFDKKLIEHMSRRFKRHKVLNPHLG
jgi:membrane protein